MEKKLFFRSYRLDEWNVFAITKLWDTYDPFEYFFIWSADRRSGDIFSHSGLTMCIDLLLKVERPYSYLFIWCAAVSGEKKGYNILQSSFDRQVSLLTAHFYRKTFDRNP